MTNNIGSENNAPLPLDWSTGFGGKIVLVETGGGVQGLPWLTRQLQQRLPLAVLDKGSLQMSQCINIPLITMDSLTRPNIDRLPYHAQCCQSRQQYHIARDHYLV